MYVLSNTGQVPEMFHEDSSGEKVFRYLQIENKMDAVGSYELAREIPLAK